LYYGPLLFFVLLRLPYYNNFASFPIFDKAKMGIVLLRLAFSQGSVKIRLNIYFYVCQFGWKTNLNG